MNRTNLILIIIILCLGVALSAAGRLATMQRREKVRLEANQAAFLDKEREYMIRDSLNAVSTGALTLKTNEFKEYFEELSSLVKDMGVRLRRVEDISHSSTKSQYDITVPIRDTIFIIDTMETIAAQALTYKDPWIELDGVIMNEIFMGSITTYDTLTQVVHRIPKRFLFFRYGTKELRQEIVSSNPHTKITYSRSIRLGK